MYLSSTVVPDLPDLALTTEVEVPLILGRGVAVAPAAGTRIAAEIRAAAAHAHAPVPSLPWRTPRGEVTAIAALALAPGLGKTRSHHVALALAASPQPTRKMRRGMGDALTRAAGPGAAPPWSRRWRMRRALWGVRETGDLAVPLLSTVIMRTEPDSILELLINAQYFMMIILRMYVLWYYTS